ncbi:MAG: FitA-like ribbon-helix-helix domain-containing protein [Acidimicrobiales bacterium]
MTAITVREVPDEVRDVLAARAAATGRSLQEYLRNQLLELARRPDPEVLLAQIRERKHGARSKLPVKKILSHLAAERR